MLELTLSSTLIFHVQSSSDITTGEQLRFLQFDIGRDLAGDNNNRKSRNCTKLSPMIRVLSFNSNL